jgi:hypothetical protein
MRVALLAPLGPGPAASVTGGTLGAPPTGFGGREKGTVRRCRRLVDGVAIALPPVRVSRRRGAGGTATRHLFTRWDGRAARARPIWPAFGVVVRGEMNAAHGCQVIAPHFERPRAQEATARLLMRPVGLVEALPGRASPDAEVVVVGHSIGGWAALCLAAATPWGRDREPVEVPREPGGQDQPPDQLGTASRSKCRGNPASAALPCTRPPLAGSPRAVGQIVATSY